MAEAAISVALFLVEKVLSTLHQEWQLRRSVYDEVYHEVNHFNKWLKTWRAHLSKNERNEGCEVRKDRIERLRDIAYDIEDVIDEFMLRFKHLFCMHRLPLIIHRASHYVAHPKALSEMHTKMTNIKKKLDDIAKEIPVFAGLNDGHIEEGSCSGSSGTTDHQLTVHNSTIEPGEITGYEEFEEKLVLQMIKGESKRTTISVVGSSGTGKTNLVSSVYYNRKNVQGLFDSHAWVQVPSPFNHEKLLRSILKQIVPSWREKPSSSYDVDQEIEFVTNHLKQKRYIIVFDDLRRNEDWDFIKNVLPDGSNGSRVILTTQNSDVASSCAEFHHTLEGLQWPHAWGLFCRKAFPNSDGKCPVELVDWAQKILKRCEGIPYAIVNVAILLSKKPPLPGEWKEFHDSLGSKFGALASLLLLPKYKDLSSNLKNCLLYFSILPEDYSIECGRLIRLWVAEGFVMETRGMTLERVAEGYLDELVFKNLVHVSKWDFDGRVRSCRVLNFVLEFLVSKSEEENFVSILADPNPISSEKVRRLSIQNFPSRFLQTRAFSGVRSAFLFRWDNLSAANLGNVLHGFKWLRVLELQNASLDEFPQYVVGLTLLRYLSLRNTNISIVPKSIENLVFLETLDLRQTRVTKLPKKIQRLHNLRHLFVYSYNVKNYVTFDSVQGVELPAEIGGLSNLQKLSLIKPDKNHNIIKELEALTQLRKLGIIGLKKRYGKDLCASVQKMRDLSTFDACSITKEEFLDVENMSDPPEHLQRLYLKGRLEKFPEWISSLSNLLRISLKWSKLRNSPLEALQKLPNLMELEMVDVYSGNELVFEAGGFKKLKKLHIEQLDQLNTVVVQERAMPNLHILILCKCKKLEILPLGINYLTQLAELNVYDMHEEFIARLQKNSEDRESVSHITVIHSFTLGDNQSWILQNLS